MSNLDRISERILRELSADGRITITQLADRVALPTRWITDGQEVPDDLHGAPERLVSSALRGDAGDWVLEAAG